MVFVSIDDNEVHHLRMLMDDVFDGNFISDFVWKSRLSEDTRALKGVSSDHEFILCFGKSQTARLRGSDIDLTKFNNPDEDARGPWRSADMTGLATAAQRPNLHYSITDPDIGTLYSCPPKGWRFDRQAMARKIKEKRVLFPSNASGRPRHKLFLNDIKSRFKNVSSVLTHTSTSEGTKELNQILGDGVFAFPKPSALINGLLWQATEEGDLILDCTAGSGTTAHAVLQLNSEDEGNRRFILTQQAQDSNKDKQEDANICRDITRERVRRVIEGVNTAALGGSFSYARLSEKPLLGENRDLNPPPSFENLARYVFYTHTSRLPDDADFNRETGFVGEHAGQAIYLLYDSSLEIEGGLDARWLERVGASDPRFHLVVYAERYAIHADDLRLWCRTHGKTLTRMLVPSQLP